MDRQPDDTPRGGDRRGPLDVATLAAAEARLRAALTQEAQYWERREPARLRYACRAPLANAGHDAGAPLRRLWVGALAAAVVCAFVLFTVHPWRTREPAPEPPGMAVSGTRRAAVVFPCTDVTDLYARLPSCPPLQRPPPLASPPPLIRPVVNRP